METNLSIAGYDVISKEKLIKRDLYEQLKLLYLLNKDKFNSKLSGTGVKINSLSDIDDLVNLINAGQLKGFNFGQFAQALKYNTNDIAKAKIKIL